MVVTTATTGANIRKLRSLSSASTTKYSPRPTRAVVQAGTTARVGRGEYFVVEADESDRSFLLFAPVVAVVTTIDREHLDQYASLEDIQSAFVQFVNRVPFYGAAVLCLDEPNVQGIIPEVKRPIITYGVSSQADLVISDMELKGMGSEFRLTYKGEDLGMFA